MIVAQIISILWSVIFCLLLVSCKLDCPNCPIKKEILVIPVAVCPSPFPTPYPTPRSLEACEYEVDRLRENQCPEYY